MIDAFARKIVGRRGAHSAETGFVLDALEQALHPREPGNDKLLIHHSDRGVQPSRPDVRRGCCSPGDPV